jgi:hypothetical protein
MKYETPELTALTPAINAIQAPKQPTAPFESGNNEVIAAYEDWE